MKALRRVSSPVVRSETKECELERRCGGGGGGGGGVRGGLQATS